LGKSPKDKAVQKAFSAQHVALETFRYFGKESDLSLIDPFLAADDLHVQASAIRAIAKMNSKEAQKRVAGFIVADRYGFAKVLALWALDDWNAREYLPELRTFAKNGKDEETGFGVSISDPRVATRFPRSVKEAVEALVKKWSQ
jgi:hypothetical protein